MVILVVSRILLPTLMVGRTAFPIHILHHFSIDLSHNLAKFRLVVVRHVVLVMNERLVAVEVLSFVVDLNSKVLAIL